MMPKIVTFKGEAPRVARRKLPVEFAGEAINTRLLSGDLEGWRNFETIEALCKSGDIVSIYPMRDPVSGVVYWLHWTQDELGYGAVEVDVARTTTANDTTGRIFLTGLDVPRWTNQALATTGSGCFPIETRPLGVPAPQSAPSVSTDVDSGGAGTINITDDFTANAGWSFSALFANAPRITSALIDNTPGENNLALLTNLPAPTTGTTRSGFFAPPPWASRNFGIERATAADYTFSFTTNTYTGLVGAGLQIGVKFMVDSVGAGSQFYVWYEAVSGIWSIAHALSTAFEDVGSFVARQTFSTPLSPATVYGFRVRATRQPGNLYTVIVTLYSGSTVITEATFNDVACPGGWIAHYAAGYSGPSPANFITRIDNVQLSAAVASDASGAQATAYVFTYVNDQGEESAPSPTSATIIRDIGTAVTVVTSTSTPTGLDYYIVVKRIYRAVTGGAGTAFFFVAEIPLSQATYIDTLSDTQLGETLKSSDWDLPPPDLRGILALPNGIYAGFFSNRLCLSEIGRPHAWPVVNRLLTDEPIVAIGAVDNQIIIATEGFPYLAAGNDPGSFSMTKLELPQGCVSKRGSAYLRGFGWIYPSPDGLVAVAGTGQAQIITAALYTRKEWQKLRPSSLIAIAHDDRYHGFYEDCFGRRRGLMLDVREQGFGAVTLGFHATAVAVQPVEDRLYMVLDVNDVPHVGSPSRTDQIIPDGRTVYAFDQFCDRTGPLLSRYLPYRWRSKKFMTRGDVPLFAVVRATDYADVIFLIYNQGYLYFVKQVTSNKPFRLPKLYAIDDYFEVELIGTSAVQALLLGYGIEDFGDGP